MQMRKLAIRDFSTTPGPRYDKDGEDSGEEFYLILQYDFLRAWKKREKLLIDFDRIQSGYSAGFLIGSFGKLGEVNTWWTLKETLKFVSNDEPGLIKEVESYIYAMPEKNIDIIEKIKSYIRYIQ